MAQVYWEIISQNQERHSDDIPTIFFGLRWVKELHHPEKKMARKCSTIPAYCSTRLTALHGVNGRLDIGMLVFGSRRPAQQFSSAKYGRLFDVSLVSIACRGLYDCSSQPAE